MPVVIAKVSTALKRKVDAAMRKQGQTQSEIVRRALERELSGGPSFAAFAKKHKGTFTGAPDLSERAGYGG